jgi:Putative transposase.
MEWDREKGEVLYRTGRRHAEERGSEDDHGDDVERIDELEFLARVVTQLPEPRKHTIRYYGYYAAVVRGKRRRATAEAEASMPAAGNDGVGNDASETRSEVGGVCPAVAVHSAVVSEPDTAERKQLRKNWAALIRRSTRSTRSSLACGATMRIVAVITERSVITKILAHLRKAAAATATEGSGPGPPRHPSPGPAPDPSVN